MPENKINKEKVNVLVGTREKPSLPVHLVWLCPPDTTLPSPVKANLFKIAHHYSTLLKTRYRPKVYFWGQRDFTKRVFQKSHTDIDFEFMSINTFFRDSFPKMLYYFKKYYNTNISPLKTFLLNCIKAGKMARASDVLRLLVLKHCGGFYSDSGGLRPRKMPAVKQGLDVFSLPFFVTNLRGGKHTDIYFKKLKNDILTHPIIDFAVFEDSHDPLGEEFFSNRHGIKNLEKTLFPFLTRSFYKNIVIDIQLLFFASKTHPLLDQLIIAANSFVSKILQVQEVTRSLRSSSGNSRFSYELYNSFMQIDKQIRETKSGFLTPMLSLAVAVHLWVRNRPNAYDSQKKKESCKVRCASWRVGPFDSMWKLLKLHQLPSVQSNAIMDKQLFLIFDVKNVVHLDVNKGCDALGVEMIPPHERGYESVSNY